MQRISAYLTIANLSFQDQMEYKENFMLSFMFKLIPFAINILVWMAVTTSTKFSMSKNEIITYYCLSLITSNLIVCTIQSEISEDIRSGMLTKYLIKPFSYYRYHFMKDIAKRLIFIILGICPIAIIFVVLRRYIVFKFSLVYILLYIVSLAIGYVLNFQICFLLSELSFYFTNVSSFFGTIDVIKNIISGAIFPLALLPGFIVNAAMLLPFSYIGFFPTAILLQQYTTEKVVIFMAIGVVWAVVLKGACCIVWHAGLKRYAAFGG